MPVLRRYVSPACFYSARESSLVEADSRQPASALMMITVYRTRLELLQDFYDLWKQFHEQAAYARETGDQAQMDYAGTLAQRLTELSREIEAKSEVALA